MSTIEQELVAAVKAMDISAVNAILDEHTIDLNQLSGAALTAGGPAPGNVIMSNSGGIVHIMVSMSERYSSKAPDGMQPILARILSSGTHVMSKDWEGYTPLHWACRLGTGWAISLLVEFGASTNACDPAGRVPLHKLMHPTEGPLLGQDAVQRLLQPLLAAGADPTMMCKEGLRPYDLLSPYARFGASAVEAGRAGRIGPDSLPHIVAGVTLYSSAGPHHRQPRDAVGPSTSFCRWQMADVKLIENMAVALDAQRHGFVQCVRLLLLWRQSAVAPHSRPLAQAAAAIPEEVFHSIMLRACPDSGLAARWRKSFDVVAEHARIASQFRQRHAALTAWLTRRDDEDATDSFLEQLSEDYDEASAAMALLRPQRGAVRDGALRAVEAYASAAHGVLYGEGSDQEGDSDSAA